MSRARLANFESLKWPIQEYARKLNTFKNAYVALLLILFAIKQNKVILRFLDRSPSRFYTTLNQMAFNKISSAYAKTKYTNKF